ncbi:sensor histidine kinase [Rubritalea marina]|uniref:sensor histidine kinase n=1 Tax=Rubritalea marina TaxID=361055 RepID=UPI00036B4D76|nr:histidine kinase [Rubritalea marina]
MNRVLLLFFLSSLWLSPTAWAQRLQYSPEKMSLNALEQRLEEIDERLKMIARYSPRTGVGAIGYRTKIKTTPDYQEWVRIDLGEVKQLEELVLVPVIWRDFESGFLSDAFPEEFTVRMGISDTDEGELVAHYDRSDRIAPRVAPLIIPVPKVRAKWIQIEFKSLALWRRTNQYAIQLSEIAAFDATENVALRRPVSNSGTRPDIPAWRPAFLTDGATPYLMNIPRGKGTVASSSEAKKSPQEHFEFIIDLEEAQPVDGLNLHAVEQSDTAPQSFAGDFGIPHHFRLEGAMSADFSDSKTLLELQFDSIFDKSTIMMWNFPEHHCRYLKLTVLDSFATQLRHAQLYRVGFAEIEITSKGKNVASGKPVTGNFSLSDRQQTFSRYTDGLNLYGTILPMRDWLRELAERHQLEAERPIVSKEIQARYTKQKKLLWITICLTVLSGAGVAVVLIYTKTLRTREAAKIRERIAANLHDELGANLHAIGLLGDMAKRLADSPEELNETLDRIRGVTERTGIAAIHCANMMEAEGICENVVDEMQRDASRILVDLKHSMHVEGESFLQKVTRRTQIDLVLFYKECLINIIRHSGATEAATELKATTNAISLVVEDNGNGYDGGLSKALQRRARLLGAKAEIETSSQGGVRIRLSLTKLKL